MLHNIGRLGAKRLSPHHSVMMRAEAQELVIGTKKAGQPQSVPKECWGKKLYTTKPLPGISGCDPILQQQRITRGNLCIPGDLDGGQILCEKAARRGPTAGKHRSPETAWMEHRDQLFHQQEAEQTGSEVSCQDYMFQDTPLFQILAWQPPNWLHHRREKWLFFYIQATRQDMGIGKLEVFLIPIGTHLLQGLFFENLALFNYRSTLKQTCQPFYILKTNSPALKQKLNDARYHL